MIARFGAVIYDVADVEIDAARRHSDGTQCRIDFNPDRVLLLLYPLESVTVARIAYVPVPTLTNRAIVTSESEVPLGEKLTGAWLRPGMGIASQVYTSGHVPPVTDIVS